MPERLPFRRMRPTLALIRIEVQLLLSMELIEWEAQDYVKFLVMSDMTKAMKSPTHNQMLVLVGAWLKFYKSLLERLPEGHELRGKVQAEFEKASEGYKELLT